MECSRIRDILFEYVDTGMPAEVRESVDAHLARCPSCAKLYDSLRAQMENLRSLPKLEAPSSLLNQVRLGVQKTSVPVSLGDRLSGFFKSMNFIRLAGTAAALFLVLATAQMVLREGEKERSAQKTGEMPGKSQERLQPLPGIETPQPPPPQAPDQSLSTPLEAPQPPPSTKAPAPAPPSSSEKQEKMKAKAPPHSGAKPGRMTADSEVEMNRQGNIKRDSAAQVKDRYSGEEKAAARLPVEITLKPFGTSPGDAVSPGALAVQRKGARGAAAPQSASRQDSVIAEARSLIFGVGGTILSENPVSADKLPASFLSEIPAENYSKFLNRLGNLGKVRPGAHGLSEPAPGEKVRVNLTLVPSEKQAP